MTYFACESCPLREECTAKNFKLWKPWGNTEDVARDQVYKHLMGSGLHQTYQEQFGADRTSHYKMLSETCEIVERYVPPSKKQRTSDAGRSSRETPSEPGARPAADGAAAPKTPPVTPSGTPPVTPLGGW